MKHLVIGLGEIGSALQKVFEADGHDPMRNRFAARPTCDMLHIAFPYSETFVEEVKKYQAQFQPKYTVIHSTVPLGTTKQIDNAVHSPVRGKHPRLYESLLVFVKFVGGPKAQEVADEFMKMNMSVRITENSADTEAMKLWDTAQYGWFILLEKAIYEYCEEHGLDFNVVYKEANETYNDGYAYLALPGLPGLPKFTRPVLEHYPGKIGGHCVIANCHLLESEVAKEILEKNDEL